MKTLQDLYSEVIANDELKNEFMEAAKDGRTTEFLKAHGCEATVEELAAFMKERESGELSDEELDDAAGGCNDRTEKEAAISAITFGIGCLALLKESSDKGYTGQKNENDGRICNIG